jgi:pilus assembly protein CpaC
MIKRHSTVRGLWPAVWLCLAVAAHAQTALPQSDPVNDAPQAEPAQIAAPVIAAAPVPIMPPTQTVPTPAAHISTGPVTVTHPPRIQGLALEAGTGRIVVLSGPAASVFAADPHVAEVRPASPTSLFVLGIAPGRTTIAVIGDGGEAIAEYDVTVRPSSFIAEQAESAIARVLHGHGVHVAARPNGLVVSGTLMMAADADLAMQTAREFIAAGQTVESRIAVLGSQQVNLRVRIAEMSRNVIRQLGINWANLANLGKYAAIGMVTANPLANATVSASAAVVGYNFPTAGHALDINAVIDAMAQDQLAHMLAEPNLTAMSGETASFLVGGEFPIPVAQQNNQITIEFKQYGVSLAFVPTVISGGHINMKVRTEVSALTTLGAVQLGVGNSTIQVPALTVRRAETTVELASGQSFAIAGLLQDSTTLTGNALPGIGELPILGALFRSDAFQRNETELVIVITPYLVSGVSSPDQIKLPTDGWKPPSEVERLLLLRQSARDPRPVVAPPQTVPVSTLPPRTTGAVAAVRIPTTTPRIPADAGTVAR